MVDRTDGVTDGKAFHTIRADPALQASLRFFDNLGFGQAEAHFIKIELSFGYADFRHTGPGHKRQIRRDRCKIAIN